MPIPGIPDEHIVRLHYYLGPGKGSEYAYKHLPSGIMVGGKCPQGMKVWEFDKQLFAEFVEKLKAAGLIRMNSSMDEQTFLLYLRADPQDDTLRLAYADWLEQEGDPRAELLRLLVHHFQNSKGMPSPTTVKMHRLVEELGAVVTKDWLALVSRGGLEFCNIRGQVKCPRRWELLRITEDPCVRRCEECDRDVWFCWTDADKSAALGAQPRWHPIVRAAVKKSE